MLNSKQEWAIVMAFADLKGAFESWRDGHPGYHDWDSHIQSIYDLIEAFPTLKLEVEDGFGDRDDD